MLVECLFSTTPSYTRVEEEDIIQCRSKARSQYPSCLAQAEDPAEHYVALEFRSTRALPDCSGAS